MLLHRLHLDPRCREARRDLSDPYQMHSTLCRAFTRPERKCPEGEFLWRLEPATGPDRLPRLLVQSRAHPDWSRIGLPGWLAAFDRGVDLQERLRLDLLQAGRRFRFRLRANPCVTRNGKRFGLWRPADQEAWLVRKGELHGYALPRVSPQGEIEAGGGRVALRVSQQQMIEGRQHTGNGIRVYAVLFDGVLDVTDPERFRSALGTGIGHGKALGLGLLSVAPTA